MFECFVHEIMSVSYNLSKHMATKGFSKWGWRKNLGVVHNFLSYQSQMASLISNYPV